MEKKLRTASLCVQGGYKPKNGEPIEVPIIQSTTFKYDNSEEMAMLFDLSPWSATSRRRAISTHDCRTLQTTL